MRKIGYALAVGGVAVLAGYAGYYFVVEFVFDDGVDLIVRLGVTGVIVGVLLVLASLIRERLRERERESFKDVER